MKKVQLLDVVKIATEPVSRFEGEKKYVATGDVINNDIISGTMVRYESKPSRANIAVLTNQILFARMRAARQVVFIDEQNKDYIYSTGFCSLQSKSEAILLPEYLMFVVCSEMFQKQKDKYAKGAAQKAISNSSLSKMVIPLPSIHQQREIVEKLRICSVLLQHREQQIDMIYQFIQSQFYECFGNPIENEKNWQTLPLAQHVEKIETGWSPTCYPNQTPLGKWGVLKLNAITSGLYREEYNKELPQEFSPIRKLNIQKDDLLMSRKNTKEIVGACSYVFESRGNMIFPDLMFRIHTKPSIDKLFLWGLCSNPSFRQCIANIAIGSSSSMVSISKRKLLQMKIISPPMGIQNQFSEFVRQAIQMRDNFVHSHSECHNLYQSIENSLYETLE